MSPGSVSAITPATSREGRRGSRNLRFTVFPFFLVLLAFEEAPQITPGRTAEGVSAPATLPEGTVLYLRLQSAVSTKASHLREAVTAQVVREVPVVPGARDIAIPVGAVVRGVVDKLIPSSNPTDRARLRLHFTQLEIPGQTATPLKARVTEVENARETVLPDGTVQGVLASELPVTMLEDALDKLKKTRPEVGTQAQKAGEKTLGKADTSIEFPAGTDLQVVLLEPLRLQSVFALTVSDQLLPAVTAPIEQLLAGAPQRASGKDGKPGDPLNLIFIGNEVEIRQAFQEAGWTEAEKLGGKSLWETVRAVAANKGYQGAPVSQLYLFGRPEDLAFQKMLNTFAERHHLRLWRSAAKTKEGREIWLGAATHDTGWDIRPGVVSHAIDPEIDQERAKVGADLVVTGRVACLRLVARPNPLSEGLTATGATWKTDGQLLAIELKAR